MAKQSSSPIDIQKSTATSANPASLASRLPDPCQTPASRLPAACQPPASCLLTACHPLPMPHVLEARTKWPQLAACSQQPAASRSYLPADSHQPAASSYQPAVTSQREGAGGRKAQPLKFADPAACLSTAVHQSPMACVLSTNHLGDTLLKICPPSHHLITTWSGFEDRRAPGMAPKTRNYNTYKYEFQHVGS